MRYSPSNEHRLLDKLKPFLNYAPSSRYPFGIGDDAVLRHARRDERLIITADTCVENVHFSLDYMALTEVGYKAMVTNLSDCAAMGARPDGALVQVVFPRSSRGVSVGMEAIYRGFGRACRKWDFPIVGGDLSAGPCWMIAITLVGRLPGRCRPLMRSGARHGDILWITGAPGESAAGLSALKKWGRASVPPRYRGLVNKHLKPVPRIEAGQALLTSTHVHAAMDVSDGISKDAATLAYESSLGAILDLSSITPPAAMASLARELRVEWKDWVAHGGEDYELLMACAPGFDPNRLTRPFDLGCTRIGRLDRNRRGIFVVAAEGLRPVPALAWDHVP
jgi:thiamine-monophosphate kinase